jgi:hypothetical protein
VFEEVERPGPEEESLINLFSVTHGSNMAEPWFLGSNFSEIQEPHGCTCDIYSL